MVAESTLEHRVDKLIERSNGRFNTNLTRVPQDDNHNYGRPPFQQNQRSRGDFWTNSHPAAHDIWQNLRDPEPSAAGSFGESDGSRSIQCFKCRGWGHPKCLCPSWLNYTRGDWCRNLHPRHWADNLRVLLSTTHPLNNRHTNIEGGPKIS